MEIEPRYHYFHYEKNQIWIAVELKDKYKKVHEVPYETQHNYDAIVVRNAVYFTGGGLIKSDTQDEQFFHTAMKITLLPDLDTKQDKIASLIEERAYHTMASLKNSYLYVVGGRNTKGDLASCEEYSIEGKKWRKIPSLTENKFSPSVCSFRSRYLYSFGGLTDNGAHGSKLIESLDTEDSEQKLWTKIVFSPGKEVWNEALFVGCAQINPEAILLFGGSIGKKMLNDSFIFNPILKTFTVGPKLGIAEDFLRAKPTITDKEVVIVGRTMLDLHTYSLITHKWQSMFKSSWNPEAPPPVKSDTI